jgi:Na+-transporting methylmalonyl-CoA/oxaloacetate decarboxylase gamma subunit
LLVSVTVLAVMVVLLGVEVVMLAVLLVVMVVQLVSVLNTGVCPAWRPSQAPASPSYW